MIDVRGITVCQLAGKVASVYREFFEVNPRLHYFRVSDADYPIFPSR